jgi:hypothetical protein
MYHTTVMQRPMEEDEDGVKRERMNGESSSSTRPYIARSPTTQTEFRPPYSPTSNGTSRAQFNSPYLPPTPAPLHMPASSHVPGPTSPKNFSVPVSGGYHTDYQSAPREKPVSNYYDPTSDSSERRPSEVAGRVDLEIQTPQVCDLIRRPASYEPQTHFLTIIFRAEILTPTRRYRPNPQNTTTEVHILRQWQPHFHRAPLYLTPIHIRDQYHSRQGWLPYHLCFAIMELHLEARTSSRKLLWL